jgi:hypothetical protein
VLSRTVTQEGVLITALVILMGCGSDGDVEGALQDRQQGTALIVGTSENGTRYRLHASVMREAGRWKACERLRVLPQGHPPGWSRVCQRHGEAAPIQGSFRYECASDSVTVYGSAAPAARSIYVVTTSGRNPADMARPSSNGPLVFVFQGTGNDLPLRIAYRSSGSEIIRSENLGAARPPCKSTDRARTGPVFVEWF